ncbi:Glycoside hydrolase family 25 [Purpureocillium lavendulum]|uniref:Glycoside hydrolase family 25 n=1 Tax=Purpureocillium lavendulum TaxID=1247861 RepID=A0AB34FRS3_9HYPO|nr:Glycoside hydrolase family 25 [Purpureocillium lavendulum]
MDNPTFTKKRRDPPGLSVAFEIDFMVAKWRRKARRSPGGAVSGGRWACPALAENPTADILRHCTSVLNSGGIKAAAQESQPADQHALWDNNAIDSWLLQPSSRAVPREDAPPEFEWVGVKLRSPLLPHAKAMVDKPSFKRCIAALQMAVHMHVNSTCQFNAFVQPAEGRMDHSAAKRLATLILLLEKHLLLPLNPSAARSMLVTEHSKLAKGRKSTRSRNPHVLASLQHHVSRIHDRALYGQLLHLWGCRDLNEVADLLCSSDGQPLAFSLQLYRDSQARRCQADSSNCLAAFRYALWHPYEQLDVTELWLRLLISICAASQSEEKLFADFAMQTHEMTTWLDKAGSTDDESLPALLHRFNLSGDESAWRKVRGAYRRGRPVSSCKDHSHS